jgi:carbon-monoxide dehydrogenase large subunit
VLAHDRVRFVGEPVAVVVAETLQQARDAAEAIWVEYEDLPAVVDVVTATQGGVVSLCDGAPDNVAAETRYGDAAQAQQAFAGAAHVVKLDIQNQRVAALALEPRTVLASIADDGRLTLRMSTQMPSGVRTTLCDVLGLTREQVRVTVGDVGGGFGMKTGAYPEDLAVAWCAWQLKRPVKWAADRSEEFLSSHHGRDVRTQAELALAADGRILALRVHSQANVGAYATGTGVAIQLLIGPWVQTSVYDIPLVDFRFQAVLTNTAPTGAYRGAGRPESIYTMERLMDEAARQSGIDRVQLRRRNFVRPEQMPYKNPMGQTYDVGRFEHVMDQALAQADWNGFEARRAKSQQQGRLRGLGIATFLEWTGGNNLSERVTVSVLADGVIEVFSAVNQMGQGIATTLAQLVVDVFGVDIDKVRVVLGDTDRGDGFGSAGSRSLFTGGSALQEGSEKALEQARTLAARELEASAQDLQYDGGRFTRARHRPVDRPVRDRRQAAGTAHLPGEHHRRRRPQLAERLPRHRGRGRPVDRRGAGGGLQQRQRHRPGGQPDHRARPARRRRGAGPGPGADGTDGLRPGQRAADHRQPDGLCGAALGHDGLRLRHQHGPVDAVHHQPAGREGRGRARHHRRGAQRGQRGGRCAGARRPCGAGAAAADAVDAGAAVERAARAMTALAVTRRPGT